MEVGIFLLGSKVMEGLPLMVYFGREPLSLARKGSLMPKRKP
jgi:hypothetical protein